MFNRIKEYIIKMFCVFSTLLCCSCLPGGSDGGFSSLIGGIPSDVSELTIISKLPSSNNLTIEVGEEKTFSILAETPPPGSVSYNLTFDGNLVSNTNAYTYQATTPDVGNHTVTANTSDGLSSKSTSWTLKVNGPPDITTPYSKPPKVSVGSTLALTVTGTDPNSDAITYDWKINGVTSPYLTFTDNTATLDANVSLLPGGFAGPVNITVTGTDTSGAVGTLNMTAEINAFNSACNNLAQFEMCTYVGMPTLGDGFNPADPSFSASIKMAPIALASDARNGNLIIADWTQNLVWYWNRTNSSVDFLQFTGASAIPANTIKVIAGTGEAATEAGDYSLNVGVNGPRGLYYDDSTDKLYISEYNASRVKIVAGNGITSYSLGVGSGDTDGTTAAAHKCSNPVGMSFYNGKLYVACYGSHKVKAWDLSTNLVDTVYGATSGNSATFKNDRSAPTFPGSYGAGSEDGKAYASCGSNCGFRNPYDVFVDATGLYVTHPIDHYVRYCNMSGGSRTVFGVTVGNGFCHSILGTGSASFGAAAANPRTTAFREPRSVFVNNGKIFVTSLYSNQDRIVLLNDTGSALLTSDYGVPIGIDQFEEITATTAGYSEGTGIISKKINEPYDIILDPDTANYPNSYFVADFGNKRVRRLDFDNNITSSVLGSGRLRDDNVGDTGLANEFYMNSPSGLVYDNQSAVDSLFVSDSRNDRILQVDKYGNVTTVLGGGSNAPNAVNGAQSPTSILYNSDAVTMTGLALFSDFSMVVNNRGYSHFQLWNRSGVAKSYLNPTTTGNNRVNQLAGDFNLPNNTTASNYDDDISAMSVSLYYPSGVAISENQNTHDREVFISDEYRHCVRRLSETGGMDTVVGICKDGSRPNNLNSSYADGGGGQSVDSDFPNTDILYRPVGLVVHYPTSTDAADAGGNPPDLNGDGNLIIAGYNGKKIRYWNRSGTAIQFAGVTIANNTVETIACTTGASNTSENIFAQGAQCNNPVSFALNNDYLCYTQNGKHNVRCIHLNGPSEGRIFTVAGSPQSNTIGVSGIPYNYSLEGLPGAQQKLNFPTGLTFDANGDLFISDQNNHLVKKVKMTP